MRTASWILIVIVAALNILGGLASSGLALGGGPDQIAGTTIQDLGAQNADLVNALRGRRLTAAAFAAGFGVMLLIVAIMPYRRGDVWAWWAILASALTVGLLIMARVPFIGRREGSLAGLLLVVVIVIALLLDAGRLRAHPAP